MATNFKPLQAQTFSLAGGGAIAGATTVILKSFQTIDGVNIAMSNLGLIAFMTLEPGMGINEEQISFTGVNQNANGTATLTGVKTVLFEYPYTQTSGLAKTHAGSTTAVLSNTSGFYNQFVAKDNDGNISETLTFENPNYPRMDIATPFPTDDEQLATKGYADSLAFAGAPDASTTVKGIVQLPTQAQVDAKTTTGSTGALLVLTPEKQRSTLLSDYVVDTGAADAYVITPSPAISAYTAGQRFSFKVATTNTGSSTLMVNALSGTTIFKKGGSTALDAGDLVAGEIVEVEYNGVNGFQLLSISISDLIPPQTGNANRVLITNGTLASWGNAYDYQSFTGSGTWTKPANISANSIVIVQIWGAGGSGGAADGNVNRSGGGGGGGGGFTQSIYRSSDLGATVTVTIGATTTGNGTTGTDSTFGSLVTGKGGVGGAVCANPDASGGTGGASDVALVTGLNLGGAPGTSNTVPGSRSINGGGGGGGSTINNGGSVGASAYNGGAGGGGGSSSGAAGAGGSGRTGFGGAGGTGGAANTAGTAGSAPGGGGGGGGYQTANGGNGARGECRVWTFL